jgi:hypothetical protein
MCMCYAQCMLLMHAYSCWYISCLTTTVSLYYLSALLCHAAAVCGAVVMYTSFVRAHRMYTLTNSDYCAYGKLIEL